MTAQDNISERPYVTCSVAMSLDGHIDDRSSERLVLSSQQDLENIDALRAQQDAILVGAGTLRRDNPRLVIRSERERLRRMDAGLSPDPVKVTIGGRTALPPDLNFFQIGDSAKLVYCAVGDAPPLRASLSGLATIIEFPSPSADPRFVLADLLKRGIKRVLVEGGESMHSLFIQAGLVDELRIAIAPFFVGDKEAPLFVRHGRFPYDKNNRLKLTAVEQCGETAVLKLRAAG